MRIAVTGSFDDLRAGGVRFLEEAARLGPVRAYLWSDGLAERLSGKAPKFPLAERQYVLESLRYLEGVTCVEGALHCAAELAVAQEGDAAARTFLQDCGLRVEVMEAGRWAGFPPPPEMDRERRAGRKKALVTGCYDWLHSGHVRFFEEAAGYGELYVIVGNDANVTNLKGPGHPLFPQDLRRYMAGSIRFVHQALITSGWGWMDAEPEIEALRPDVYVVNEDGDRPEKRAFCAERGLEYVVLKRLPRPGLEARSSTDLRGF